MTKTSNRFQAMIDKYNLYYRLFITAFWVMQCFGFVSEELLPPLAKLRSPIYLLCDAIIFFVGIAAIKENQNKTDKRLAIWFLIIAVVSTLIINQEGISALLNGSRDFFGLIFILPILRFFFTARRGNEHFVKVFDRQLYIYLWLQAVCITWQFIKYGVGDHGGGTMGYGASGTASTCIYFISYYLMTKRWNEDKNYFRNLSANWVLVFLLYPSFLNETKISFIFLMCYFLLLIEINKRTIKYFVIAIPAMIVVLIGLWSVYLDITDQDADELTSKEFYDNYLFGGDDLDRMIEVGLMVQDGTITIDESDVWSVDIPRFTKILKLPELFGDCRGGAIFGAGLGQFKGGTTMEMSRFAKDNQWLLLGSRPWLFFVMVQLGIIGLIWFLIDIGWVLSYKKRTYIYSKNIKIYLTVILALTFLYNDSLRFFQYCTILFFIALYATIKAEYIEDNNNQAQMQQLL